MKIVDEFVNRLAPSGVMLSLGDGIVDTFVSACLSEEKWITIGGKQEGDKKHVGGFKVKIDGEGNIVKGRMKGTNVKDVKKKFDEKKTGKTAETAKSKSDEPATKTGDGQGAGENDVPGFSESLPIGSIYKVKIKDGERFAVRGESKNGFGDTLHQTKSEAVNQAELDKKTAARKESLAKEREEAEAKAKAAKDDEQDIDGYASNLPSMQKGKVVATLNAKVRSNGEVKSRKQHIRDAISKGVLSVEKNSLGSEVLMRSDGRVGKVDGGYQEGVAYQWSLGSPRTEVAYAKHLLADPELQVKYGKK